jgi:hypothetical protein
LLGCDTPLSVAAQVSVPAVCQQHIQSGTETRVWPGPVAECGPRDWHILIG